MVTYYLQEEKHIPNWYTKNEQIKAEEIRLISAKGENLGVVKTREALDRAKEEELDLVLIVPNANPPVAKIVDFKKFLYEERKKASTARAKSKKTDIKEFWLSPSTGEGDIQRFIKRAREFILDGNKVKITVKMRGREAMFPEVAMEQIKRIGDGLSEIAKMESEPKRMGNMIWTIFTGK